MNKNKHWWFSIDLPSLESSSSPPLSRTLGRFQAAGGGVGIICAALPIGQTFWLFRIFVKGGPNLPHDSLPLHLPFRVGELPGNVFCVRNWSNDSWKYNNDKSIVDYLYFSAILSKKLYPSRININIIGWIILKKFI